MADHPDNGLNYRAKIESLLNKHIVYFDHMNWPKEGTEEYDDMLKTWCEAFGEKRYSPNVVARACLAIRKKPPQWKPDHLPELLRLIEEKEAESNGRNSAADAPSDPNAPPCPHCADTPGFATAYRSDYRGLPHDFVTDADGNRRLVHYRITAPCICPKGRRIWRNWINHEIKSQDLAALPRGWTIEGSGHEHALTAGASDTPY